MTLALTACNHPQDQARIPQPHPTIVSLNPCSDAILAEVTVPGQLLAISHYSHDPSSSSMGVGKASRYRSVTSSVEEIAALHPDVVVSDIFLQPATAQALHELGIAVVTIGSIDGLAASEAQVRQLAGVARNVQAGERLVARIERALAGAKSPARSRAVSAIVWESGGIVAGDRTLIADLLRRTGFTNAAAARGLGQADYLPLEAMIADPPHVILTTGDPRANADRLLSHPALAGLTNTRRVAFDSALLWCGGPTIVRAADRLAEVRHDIDSDGVLASRGKAPVS